MYVRKRSTLQGARWPSDAQVFLLLALQLVDGLPKLHIKGIPVRSELNHVEFQMRMARAFDRFSLLLALKDLPLLSRDNRTFFFEQINMLPNLEELLADPDNAGAGYLRKRSQAGAASEAAAMALAPAEALVAKDGVALLAADRVPPVEQAPSEPAVEAQAVDTGGAAAESAGETHASSPSAAAAASAASAEGAASSAVAVAAAAAAGSTPTAAGAGTNDERAKQPANAEQTSDAPAARGRKARGRKGQEAAGDEDESAAPAGAGSRKRRGTSVEADEPVRKKLRSA